MRDRFLRKIKSPNVGMETRKTEQEMCLTLGVTAGCLFLAPKGGEDERTR